MNGKEKRHMEIRMILGEHGGSTQEEIASLLDRRGIRASQSTLSRDLRELGAVKIPVEAGGARYVLSGGDRLEAVHDEIGRAVRSFSVSHEQVGNFLVVRTSQGSAQAFCVLLDRQGWPEIVGTIAGDDTILVIARTPADILSIVRKLSASIEEENQ